MEGETGKTGIGSGLFQLCLGLGMGSFFTDTVCSVVMGCDLRTVATLLTVVQPFSDKSINNTIALVISSMIEYTNKH